MMTNLAHSKVISHGAPNSFLRATTMVNNLFCHYESCRDLDVSKAFLFVVRCALLRTLQFAFSASKNIWCFCVIWLSYNFQIVHFWAAASCLRFLSIKLCVNSFKCRWNYEWKYEEKLSPIAIHLKIELNRKQNEVNWLHVSPKM